MFFFSQTSINLRPHPFFLRQEKDAAALDVKTNVALIYLKKKKSVFMMLIYEKRERERRKERTVLPLLLFNALSDDNVIILKSTNLQRCFSFWKKLICVSFEA